jgi:hypothetical protein
MYEVNERKMFYDTVDDRTIVINSETGIYYGINNFSTTVFEHIIKGAAVAEILAAINKIPDAPADMEQRLQVFVKELQDKEIIIEGPTLPIVVNIKAELAIKDNFALSVIEFADAQEMLLADPIPDMEEFDGWQPFFEITE